MQLITWVILTTQRHSLCFLTHAYGDDAGREPPSGRENALRDRLSWDDHVPNRH